MNVETLFAHSKLNPAVILTIYKYQKFLFSVSAPVTYIYPFCRYDKNRGKAIRHYSTASLKGLSHEIDFKNVVENGQILALIRAAAGFLIFRRLI
jgi:hypothetical protein